LLYHQSTVFSEAIAFVRSEKALSANIKCKLNRGNVGRILTITEKQLIKMQPSEMGYLIFVGIDNTGNEIVQIMEPPYPVISFHYTCARTFVVEPFLDLYKKKQSCAVVFVSGTDFLLFEYEGIWKRSKKATWHRVKRHHMGGSSSKRFERLADENLMGLIKRFAELINECSNSETVYLFGSRHVKELLIKCPVLTVPVKPIDMFHEFDADTIKDKFFTELAERATDHDQQTKEIVELMTSDMLLFSLKEILLWKDLVKYVCIIKPERETEIILDSLPSYVLEYSSRYYAQLKDFTIIAVLRYPISPDILASVSDDVTA